MSRIRVLSGKRPIYTNIDIKIDMNISYIFSYIFSYICLVNIVRTCSQCAPSEEIVGIPQGSEIDNFSFIFPETCFFTDKKAPAADSLVEASL